MEIEQEIRELRDKLEAKLMQRDFERERGKRCPHCGQPMPDQEPDKLVEPKD
jgi:DNA repair exonuclease SbcCD ATPase subunit